MLISDLMFVGWVYCCLIFATPFSVGCLEWISSGVLSGVITGGWKLTLRNGDGLEDGVQRISTGERKTECAMHRLLGMGAEGRRGHRMWSVTKLEIILGYWTGGKLKIIYLILWLAWLAIFQEMSPSIGR